MLILTRGVGDVVRIGADGAIKIKIIKSSYGQVQVGIDAPREISVHREEVYQRIQQEKQQQGT